jgi:LacI family transcriptional regulator
LHNWPGVSVTTKRKVLRAAEKLGYRPNLAARFLSSSKRITIGVAIPREVAYFHDEVREGIFEAAGIFEPLGIKILHRPYDRFGLHEIKALRDVLQEDISGLIISPAHPNKLLTHIDEAARRNIPVVCVATDAPGTKRLTSISVNPLVSGALAGDFLFGFQPVLNITTAELGTIETERFAANPACSAPCRTPRTRCRRLCFVPGGIATA